MTEAPCPHHPTQIIRWQCDTCKMPLCEACGAGALEGKVYCPTCLANAKPIEATPAQTSERGVGLGIGLALLLIFVVPSPLWWLLRSVPWLAFLIGNPFVTLGVAYWIARRKKRPGIAKGLLIGAVIWIALLLLLMAACFGLVFVLNSVRR